MRMHAAILAGVLAASAQAQTTALPRVNLDRLTLNPSASGSLTIHDGEQLRAGSTRIGVVSEYASGLLISEPASGVLAFDRLYGTALGSFGVTDWLQLNAQLPFVLNQGVTNATAFAAPPTSALAPVTLSLRAGIPQSASFPLSISGEVGANMALGDPTALVAFSVSTRPTPFARLNAGYDLGFMRLFAEVNAQENIDLTVRTGSTVVGRISDDVGGGLGFSIPLPSGFAIEAAGLVRYQFEEPATGTMAQVHAGLRWKATQSFSLVVAGGPAFGDLIGTPDWRAFGGILFHFDKAPAEQKKTPDVVGTPLASNSGGTTSSKVDCSKPNADPSACPDADLDGDGVANRVDQCLSQPEDLDGFSDTDGCAEADNDGDSIADLSDKCPNEAGVPKFAGCPIPDADKDGIADADDACPNEYGLVAARGCAVKDADGDSFADAQDACPTKAGIVELKGCPTADRDADGVFDHLDNCPRERGLTDNGGCPAKKKQLVIITPETLELREKVFFVTKKAKVQPRSMKLIKQIAAVMKQAKHIDQVRVEVHGDDDLNAEKNRKLTQDRAEAVRAALVKAGVAPDRLVAVGRGNEDPIDPKKTFKAKATNRRVELKIVQPEPLKSM